MSSTYVAVPVMSRGSSRRRMRLPTRVSVLVMVVAMFGSSFRSSPGFSRGGLYGVDDVLIARAAAQVAVESVPDLFLGGLWIALEQLPGGHDHARRAETALQGMLVPESLLDGMQMAIGGEALDGQHLAAVGLDGEHGAGLYSVAVERHGAGPANGSLAPDVRPGEAGD